LARQKGTSSVRDDGRLDTLTSWSTSSRSSC